MPKATAFLPPDSGSNPDSGGSSKEIGDDLSLWVILLNLTVSIECLPSGRSHAGQVPGMPRHMGYPHGQCPLTLQVVVRGVHGKLPQHRGACGPLGMQLRFPNA